ncbi:hypothetical protein CsSME_00035804 [Camellia sinensis var. sinensis]
MRFFEDYLTWESRSWKNRRRNHRNRWRHGISQQVGFRRGPGTGTQNLKMPKWMKLSPL